MLSLLLTICLALNICTVNVFSAENSTSVGSFCIGGLYTSGTNLGKELQSSNRARSKMFFLNDAQLEVNISDNSVQYGVFYYDADMKCTGWTKWLAKSSVQTEQDSVYARIVFKYKDNHDISEMELNEFEKYLKYTIKPSDKNILVDGIVLGSCYLSGNQMGNELAATNRARTRFYDLSRMDIKLEADTKEIQYGYFYYDGFLKCTEWSGWKSESDTISKQNSDFVRIIFRFKDNRAISDDEIIELAKCVKLIPTLKDNTTTLKLGSLYTSGSYIGKELGSTTRARSDYYELKENRVKVELPGSGQQYAVFFYDENKECMGTSGWTSGSYKDIDGAVYVRVVFRYADNRMIEEKELPGLEAGIGFEKRETEPEVTTTLKLGSLYTSGNYIGKELGSTTRARSDYYELEENRVKVELPGSGQQYAVFFYDENKECMGTSGWTSGSYKDIDGAVYVRVVFRYADNRMIEEKELPGLEAGIGFEKRETEPEVTNGTCGASLTWSFNSARGLLSICGSGAMTNFSSAEETPWFKFKDSILSVEFNGENIEIGSHAFEGLNISSVDLTNVVAVGDCAFKNCKNIQGLVDASNITWIGEGCFENCSNINSIYIGSNVTYIGDAAIKNCSNLSSIVVAENAKFEGNISLEGVSDNVSIVVGKNMYVPIGDNDTPAMGTATVISFSKNENGETEIKKNGKADVLPPMGVVAESAAIVGDSTVVEGKSITLRSEIYPENAVNRGFTWTTSDEKIATVGLVSQDTKTVNILGIKVGEVTVKAVNKNNGVSAEFIVTVTCAHNWEDGICTKCGEVCEHDWKDGACIVCKKVCLHKWSNGRCEICGAECHHEFESGKCSICGYECVEHKWSDGICSICGKVCDHKWSNGGCEICGAECHHEFESGKCSICGYECVEHKWSDGICNICGKVCDHKWSNGRCEICGTECHHEFESGKCSICGYECKWHSWSEGICTVCGEKCTHDGASYLQEARFDYDWDCNEFKFVVAHSTYCDTCNLAIAEECCDNDNNGLCDVCGECMHSSLRKEQVEGHMHNITCENCNKLIIDYSPCEDMNGDNVCDICGSMLYFEPGMGECGCGCYMPGCTCGSECPICGNTGMMSSDTVVEEFNDGDSDSDVFTSGDEGKSDFKDDLG